MPDLLVASCLSRRTIERVATSEYGATPDTLAALDLAVQFLDPTYLESIAGWRDVITVEELARLLNISCRDAQDRQKGRKTWRQSERAMLVEYLMIRQARLGQQV
jgi:hypothetical protein